MAPHRHLNYTRRAQEFQKIIGVDSIDLTKFLEALNCSGRPLEYHGVTIRTNSGLCQIGGPIVTAVLVMRWYRSGLGREICKDFVEKALDDDALYKIGREKGIDKLIVVAEGVEGPSKRDVSCSVVAVVGAALLDDGYEAARGVVEEELGIGDETWEILSSQVETEDS